MVIVHVPPPYTKQGQAQCEETRLVVGAGRLYGEDKALFGWVAAFGEIH